MQHNLTKKNSYLEVGRIIGAVGIKGDLKVKCLCDSSNVFCRIKNFYFGSQLHKIKVISLRSKNILIIHIFGIDDRNSAENLKENIIYALKTDILTDDNCYFIQDLINMSVIDVDNAINYGIISDVIKGIANDVYVVTSKNGREYFVPAIKDVICDINFNLGTVFIRPIKGIFDDED